MSERREYLLLEHTTYASALRNVYNLEDGAFAEYANAKPEVSMKVPDNLSNEEAASLGVSVTTVVCL